MELLPIRRTGLAAFLVFGVLGLTGLPSTAQAQSQDSYLIAQNDPDEAFDPFSDYSEFDEASDEEADINFFRNGRFFTLGVIGGMRNFTGNWKATYGEGATYGLAITYFFDLRSAFSLSFLTGDHSVHFQTNVTEYSGNVSMSSLNFDYKHYFNTQNITRGLADLNPYLLIGFGQFYRSYSLDNYEGSTRDSTMGLNLGAGLEIPLLRRKAFFGIQGAYHMVNFSDENKSFIGSERLTRTISGDFFDVTGVLGMNF